MGTDHDMGPALRLDLDATAGPEELFRLTDGLRRELLEIGVGGVRRGTDGQAPDGARALDAQSAGTLLVSLVTAPEALRAVVGAVRGWLARSRARSVYLELDGDVVHVTGVSSAEQTRLIDAWIARRARS